MRELEFKGKRKDNGAWAEAEKLAVAVDNLGDCRHVLQAVHDYRWGIEGDEE
ncbi:MAG: hypothetical protein LBK25_08230 [Treponema sp.]|nr:hypothetical protein [Treponema sp.]